MNASIRKFFAEEDGVSALEYGILACVVAAALVTTFKQGLTNVFTTVMSAVTTAVGTATSST